MLSVSKPHRVNVPLARYRVLLVDDDGAELRSMAAALEFEPELAVEVCTSAIGRQPGGAGAHYVLVKPVDPTRLATMILQLARTAEMTRGTKRVARREEHEATR